MEFLTERCYTALNADELKVGSKCIFSNNLDSLRCKVVEGTDIRPIVQILNDTYERRFQTNVRGQYPFAYLISEAEGLRWTDLKLGDVIKEKEGTVSFLVTGIDTDPEATNHIFARGRWNLDSELEDWEKVE